jgi:hypothetical protein
MALYTMNADGSSVALVGSAEQDCCGVGSDWTN